MKTQILLLLFLVAGTLFAFDRNFSVTGSGQEAPRLLQVFRRGKNCIVVLDSSRPAEVTAVKGKKKLFTLSTGESEKRILQEKNITVWSLPDASTGIKEGDFVEFTARFINGKKLLPDAAGYPLLVSGRKGREYSWNDENGTILSQVSNTKVDFTDEAFDIPTASCGDLISGKAEVKADHLELTAVLRTKTACDMRVLIDSISRSGYSGDGIDFMLDNHLLSRFAGSRINHWKWQTLQKISFKKEGNTAFWRVPLSLLRTRESGRIRVRFQTICPKKSCGDCMPTHGKILPVLRPGNLAAEKTTAVTVTGLHPQYKIYPLTDGQTSRRIHWCFESFAAGDNDPIRGATFTFSKPEKIRLVIVWWEALPKKPVLQYQDAGSSWKTLPFATAGKGTENALQADNETGAVVQQASIKLSKEQEKSYILLPEGFETRAVRLLETDKTGSFWVREIEIY